MECIEGQESTCSPFGARALANVGKEASCEGMGGREMKLWLAAFVLCVAVMAGAAERTVPGDFSSIQQALHASQAGDTVHVGAGRYAGPIQFKDGVRLVGAGSGQVVVECGADSGPGLTVAGCANGVISGITFEQTARAEAAQQTVQGKAEPPPVCLVRESSVEFVDCEAHGGLGNGFAILGKGSPVFRSCTARRNNWSGFYVKGPEAAPTLSKNVCAENGASGIFLDEGSDGSIQENECTQNAYCGIFVTGPNTEPAVSRNTCSNNRGNGIGFEHETSGSVEGNRCAENGINGLCVRGPGTRLSVSSNVFTGNGCSGTWVSTDAATKGTGNAFSKNREISEAEIAPLFDAEDYAGLEGIAERLRKEKSRYQYGGWQIHSFYDYVTQYCSNMGAPEEANFIRKIDAWKAAYPDSITWRVALAKAYSSFGWRERGGGFLPEVSREGLEGFRKYTEKAWNTVQEAQSLKPTDPEYYAFRLSLAIESQGLAITSQPRSTGIAALWKAVWGANDLMEDCFIQGQTVEPLYLPLYGERVRGLLPRWGGPQGALMKFADAAADKTRDLCGEMIYAEIAIDTFSCEGRETFMGGYSFSWPRLEEGLKEFEKQFPEATYYRNFHCVFACLYEQQDTAKQLFEQIGDYWYKPAWDTHRRFETWRKWAVGQAPYPVAGELERAIMDGDTSRVQELIKAGANPKDVDMDGDSMLVLAMRKGPVSLMAGLIDAGADLNHVSAAGMTPLLLAVDETSPEYLNLLLEKGADPNVKGHNGWSPLLLALARGKADRANLLIQRGADPNYALNDGWTPLHYAVQKGLTETVKLLLDRGVNPKERRKGQDIGPLTAAADAHNIEACLLLLDHGSDPNEASLEGRTVLFGAVEDGGNLDLVRLLVSKGANIHAKENDGWTVFHSAVDGGNRAIVEYLLELDPQGAKVVTNEARTLLHHAVKKGNVELVTLLLDRGIDVNARDSGSGLTALGYAQKANNSEIAALLKARRAKE